MFKKGDKIRCTSTAFPNLTEGKIYEAMNDEIIREGYIEVITDDYKIGEFWSSRFELVEEEKKMYKEEDIYAGMKLKCIDNGGYTSWTNDKIYVVITESTGQLHILHDNGGYRDLNDILSYLNGDKKIKMEVYEEPIEEEEEEITLTIKGKTFYDIRNEAEELLNLVNSIIEASEELGISEEKVRRIYGGKTNE